MGRRMKRRPMQQRAARWRAVRGPFGRWIVVNEFGEEPLRTSDPVEQLMAAHLAAAAPGLREALEELARRLLYLETPYTRDARRVDSALGEVALSRPSASSLLGALAQRSQLELDLSASEVA